MFGGRYQIRKTDFGSDSLFRSRQYEFGWSLKSDSSLDKEPSAVRFSIDNSFKNIEDIISVSELAAISDRYKEVAKYSLGDVGGNLSM